MRAFLNSSPGTSVPQSNGSARHNAYVETVEAIEFEPVEAEIVPPRPAPVLAPAGRPNGSGQARTEAVAAPLNMTSAPMAAPALPAPVMTSAPAVDIREALLKVVSDRTGYPVEMLGIDLDMEADLGIDSIKRIEILSALQQMGGRDELASESTMEEVARLKTLRQVLDFFRARS